MVWVSFAETWAGRGDRGDRPAPLSPRCFLAAGKLACLWPTEAPAPAGPGIEKSSEEISEAPEKNFRWCRARRNGGLADQGWSGHVESGGQQPKNVVDTTGPGPAELCD